MKAVGWIVEWREVGFKSNGREVDFYESRAAADRAIAHEKPELLSTDVLTLYRVTVDPKPVRVLVGAKGKTA